MTKWLRSLESGVKRGEKNFIDNLIIFKHKTMKKEQSIDVIKRIERLERKVEEIRWNSLEDYQKQNETWEDRKRLFKSSDSQYI